LCEVYNNKQPYYHHKKYTPDPIDVNDMGENDIFVFGSNTEGNHAGGAAKAAVIHYGAITGQARGLQGNSYGIVTLDYTSNELVNLDTMKIEIQNFIKYASENPHLTFWLTKIGTGISKYVLSDIASLFHNLIIPENIILPYEFANS